MEISTDQFCKAVDENNRTFEMALRYAALILTDFQELSRENQKVMADILMALILGA